MEVNIDQFGRVLIPKKIRDHLGITPGAKMNIQEAKNGVVKLKLAEIDEVLHEEGGVLVFQGHRTDDLEKAVNSSREERIKKLWE